MTTRAYHRAVAADGVSGDASASWKPLGYVVVDEHGRIRVWHAFEIMNFFFPMLALACDVVGGCDHLALLELQ